MATRTALKIKEAMMQYSKVSCTRVTFFWMAYRVAISLLVYFRPETANAMVHFTDGVDTVQIINMSVYCATSGTEKIAVAFGKRNVYNLDSPNTKSTKDDEETEETEDSTEDNG